MTLSDAREFTRIIRKEKYKPNPLEEQFIKQIEDGHKCFVNNSLSDKQQAWLKRIYGKATER